MSNLVTFEQAKKLNDLGYTERAEYAYLLHQKSGNHRLYSPFGRMDYNQNNNRDNSNKIAIHYSAPAVSDALDWIREKKGIACGVHPYAIYEDMPDGDQHFVKWGYKYVAFQGLSEWQNMNKEVFDTHPLGSSALLTDVLEYLIEKEK